MYLNGTCLSGPRFSDPRFPGEFAPQGCLFPDYPVGDYEEPDFSGFDYPARQDSLGSGMDRRPFPDALGHRPPGHGDGFGPGGGRDGYGRSGLLEDNPGRMHTEYRTSLLDRPIDKSLERPGLMGAAPESSNRSNTLLTYLVWHLIPRVPPQHNKCVNVTCSNFSKCVF